MATPSRRARACGDVTSGAEEAEWCSEGQTKGGAGGAQRPAAGRSGGGAGLPAGRPDRAGPGRQLPWSERNAETLPRQMWASLSAGGQHADSRAVHGILSVRAVNQTVL